MKKLRFLLVTLSVLLISGCIGASKYKPTITYLGTSIDDISREALEATMVYDIKNNSSGDIQRLFYDYTIFINDKEIKLGEKRTLNLRGYEATQFTIPIRIPFDEVFETRQSLAKQYIEGDRRIAYTMHVQFRVDLGVGDIKMPNIIDGEFPLPKPEAEDFKTERKKTFHRGQQINRDIIR